MTDDGTDRSGDDAEADSGAARTDAEGARRAADAIEEVGVERLTDLIVEAAREAPEGFDPDAGDDEA